MGRNNLFKYCNPSNPILKEHNAKSWKSRRRNDARSFGMISEFRMPTTQMDYSKPKPLTSPVKCSVPKNPSDSENDPRQQVKRRLFDGETDQWCREPGLGEGRRDSVRATKAIKGRPVTNR